MLKKDGDRMKYIKGHAPELEESYRQLLIEEYRKLQLRKWVSTEKGGLEEVKLRLFLSLLSGSPLSHADSGRNCNNSARGGMS